MDLTGFHHLTAITADPSRNHAFYTRTLGMRLVKKTVNQDDVSAYHLFYADGLASPGSDVTFFDWPVTRERRGTNSIVRTGLRVDDVAALEWWHDRLRSLGIGPGDIGERHGFPVLDFEDPEGQRLSLIADPGQAQSYPWDRSRVPPARQIRGLGWIAVSVPDIAATETVLCGVLNMRKKAVTEQAGAPVHIFEMGGGGSTSRMLTVAVEPHLPRARQGAGGAHHVALRTPDDQSYAAWAERLRRHGLPSSGPIDRYYFKSLYFREPGGILIEIATDGPGFGTDEPLERLGERLALPPILEPRRREIEAGLKPLEFDVSS